MESVTQKLFTELFRPKKLDGVIAPPRIKNELSRGLVQNILLYGSPGCGKSSTARILIADYDTLQLNGSAERGIDIYKMTLAEMEELWQEANATIAVKPV